MYVVSNSLHDKIEAERLKYAHLAGDPWLVRGGRAGYVDGDQHVLVPSAAGGGRGRAWEGGEEWGRPVEGGEEQGRAGETRIPR